MGWHRMSTLWLLSCLEGILKEYGPWAEWAVPLLLHIPRSTSSCILLKFKVSKYISDCISHRWVGGFRGTEVQGYVWIKESRCHTDRLPLRPCIAMYITQRVQFGIRGHKTMYGMVFRP